MSTQEIGELIDSVNDLTQTVAGKMGEINQELQQGLKEIEDKVTAGFSGETRYVSPNGNDTSGDGSSSKPFKTIRKAINSILRNGKVILKDPGSYYYHSNVTTLVGRSIYITGEYLPNDDDAKIYFSRHEDGTPANWPMFKLENSDLNFKGCQLLSDGQDTTKPSYDRGLVFAYAGTCSVKFGESGGFCSISLADKAHFLGHVARSLINIMTAYTSVNLVDGDGTKNYEEFYYREPGTTVIQGVSNSSFSGLNPPQTHLIGGTIMNRV